MHVQFVVRPRGSLPRVATDGGTLWRIVDTGDESMELIEIMYNGRLLTRGEGLSGLGYTHFQVENGDIRFIPQALNFTLPVRYDHGWSSSSPGVSLIQDSNHLIQVKVPSSAKNVTLSYRPAGLFVAVGIGTFCIALLIAIALVLLRYWHRFLPRANLPG